ncbi:CHAD domain-containing protein [Marilutibacter chinensis]|uniref:CHAD domain-containing protein n=1 Tax=Marilutibacter chinensis TaxID=2912247 RepID=A0ABS9HS79_9GAMM|nr:CHAD domain-containing protein [Lysobacter chinensis]MCF7221781.1 CHAD domain-containing protein [Lysobacter chinensis]MCF7223717.1 CHAD domain-containing protein [Lysobacter chinensis]
MTDPEGAQPGPRTTRPFGLALHHYARVQLDAALDWLDAGAKPSKRLHKGIHQGRKALRRVRATLALGVPALGPGSELIDRELRRIIRGLGDIRDGQALLETLDRLHANGPTPAVAAHLEHARRAVVRRRRALADATLAADPGLARRRALLTALAGTLDALPWATVDAETVDAALQASAQAVDKARERVVAGGRDRDWHRWRRRMRRRSQQRTALDACRLVSGDGPPSADPPAPPVALDKDLAVLLGVAQDLSLLLEHCGRDGGLGKADRTALAAFARTELSTLRDHIRRCA